MVPHRGTNWAALWLTAQIGRDAVLSESYGRGYQLNWYVPQIPILAYSNIIIDLWNRDDGTERMTDVKPQGRYHIHHHYRNVTEESTCPFLKL